MNQLKPINNSVTQQSADSVLLALSQLTQVNPLFNDTRWVFLIAPKGLPSKQQLLDANINTNRLLVIHGDQQQIASYTLKALSSGNAAAVVGWGVDVNQSNREIFMDAAKQGESLFVAIC